MLTLPPGIILLQSVENDKQFIVVNCHLQWNPIKTDVKVLKSSFKQII